MIVVCNNDIMIFVLNLVLFDLKIIISYLMHYNKNISFCHTVTAGVKIAVGHQIFLTELIKSFVSYVDKFSKMSDSKKKEDKILKRAFHKTVL